ncbi:MAG: hypothetical protein EXR68_06315, partial [Dehalococcoidia bacterium]|nr:hypothetical protein [Dehalococcoidia bacterium]
MATERPWIGRRVGRRAALRGGALAAFGLGAAALIGCGGEEEASAPAGAAPAPGKPVAANFLTNPADTTAQAVRGG